MGTRALLRYNVTVADGCTNFNIFVPRVKNNYCHLSHKKLFWKDFIFKMENFSKSSNSKKIDPF